MPRSDSTLMLVVTLVGPLLLGLLARERALRGPGDRAARWFAYARRAQYLTIWGSMAWLLTAASAIAKIDALGRAVFHDRSAGAACVIIAILVPVALTSACLGVLTHDVSHRLETSQVPWRDLWVRLGWSLLGTLSLILGLAFGLLFIVRGSAIGFLVAMIVGVFVGGLGLSRHRATLGMTLHSVTHGDLRDRLFALAARARVKLDQLYVLPMKKIQLANAFAVSGQRVFVTDLLLERLTRDEVDAIMAHEMAHLRHHHPHKLGLAGALLCGLPFAATMSFGWGWAIAASWLGMLVVHAISRRIERTADREAIGLGAEPRAFIAGLVRLAQLGHVPIRWNRWTGWMVTHPSVEERAKAIGAAGGLAEDEIARLLEGERVEGAHYPAHPAGDPESRVFSTTAKTVILSRISLTLIGLALLVPAATFAALRFAPHAIGLAAALLLAPAVCLIVLDFFAVQPLHPLASRVAKRVGLGPRPREAGWALAGLSPHAEARVYEGFSNWDLGFVRVSGGRLEYVGEETRFALSPRSITRVELTRDSPGWISPRLVRITWRDDEDKLHALRLSPLGGVGLHSITGGSRKLAAAIEALGSGVASEPARASDPESTLALGLPPRGEVTCATPRSLVKVATLIQFLVLDLILGVVAALLYRRPFDPTRAGSFIEVVAVAFATQLFLMFPAWRHRDSAGTPESAPTEQKRAA